MGLGTTDPPRLNLVADEGDGAKRRPDEGRLLGTEVDAQKGRDEHPDEDSDDAEGEDDDGQPEECLLHMETF